MIKLFEFPNREIWAGESAETVADYAAQATGDDYEYFAPSLARELGEDEINERVITIDGESVGEENERMTFARLLMALESEGQRFPSLFSMPLEAKLT